MPWVQIDQEDLPALEPQLDKIQRNKKIRKEYYKAKNEGKRSKDTIAILAEQHNVSIKTIEKILWQK